MNIKDINQGKYGPLCQKCDSYAHKCRCTYNNSWNNRDLVFHMKRVYVNIINEDSFENKSMEAPIQILARDLVQSMKDIELCGKTVDEVMKYAIDNYENL